MLIDFFLHLKSAKLPVSTREFLTLLDALKHDVVSTSIDDFYFLARTCLVKDEALYDRFNLAFGAYFNGVTGVLDIHADIPEEWLRKMIESTLTDEEKALVAALGGWETLMETLRRRLEEQRGRHQGGSKWIGTAGTSPFGAYGYNPEGIRIGQQGGRNRSAIKVWDERTFRNLDDSVEINTRNIKIALRRLRRFARQGVPDEFDLDTTIESRDAEGTAHDRLWRSSVPTRDADPASDRCGCGHRDARRLYVAERVACIERTAGSDGDRSVG